MAVPIHKFQQITSSHCGPAVMQMLLDSFGVETTQQEITKAAGAENTIREQGTRIDQLAIAAGIIAPQLNFWFKYKSTIDDLVLVLSKGHGVGVEWQGMFYDTEEEEEDDDDLGHYSIVSYVDVENQQLIIVDPYKRFVHQDRILDFATFLPRWWDTNEVRNPETGRNRIVVDEQLIFFLAPQEEEYSVEAGYQKFSPYRTVEERTV